MNSKKAITLLVLATMLMALVPVIPANAVIDTIELVDGAADIEVGETYTVTGEGVTAGSVVMVYWDAVKTWNGIKGYLNETEAEADGTFEVEVTIPEALNGLHYIWAKDTETGATAFDADGSTVMATLEIKPGSGLSGDGMDIIGHGFGDEVTIDTIVYLFANATSGNLDGIVDISPAIPETDELGKWTGSFDIPDGITSVEVVTITATDEGAIDGEGDYDVGPSLEFSVDEGPVGAVITIDGRGFDEGVLIDDTMIVFDDGAATHPYVEDDDTVDGGEFSIQIVIPSLAKGDYEITIDTGLNEGAEGFTVDGTADLSVDPTFGVQGASITVTGANFTQISGTDVLIELWSVDGAGDPDVNLGEVDTVETDSNGNFEEVIKVPAQSNGVYKLVATQDDYIIDASDDFKIGSVIVFLSDSEGPSGLEVILSGTGFEYDGDWNATIGDIVLIEENAVADEDGNLQEDGAVPKFYVPTLAPGDYTINVMDEEGTNVDVDFTVTETTTVWSDPSIAPNEYELTIYGKYFTQMAGTELEFVLWNATETWDMVVEFDAAPVEVVNENDEGEWNGTWTIPDSDELSLGTYYINATDDDGLWAIYEFTIVDKTVKINSRKSTFSIGDTVAFDVESSFSQDDSYIKVYNPSGILYWQTAAFDDDAPNDVWLKVGTIERVPYYEQVAGGNPMTLLDDAPLGEWSWIWNDVDDEELDTGVFSVVSAEADVIGGQVTDLANDISDLADQLTDVTGSFADVQSSIADVSALARDAVAAANAAADAVTAVAATANTASEAAADAAEAANAARDAASGLTTLVYGAIGAALVAALAAIVSLMQISRRIAG